jgi:glyoxylase-like metal-dependent hydrolase (beta-lactamase superfamily II)
MPTLTRRNVIALAGASAALTAFAAPARALGDPGTVSAPVTFGDVTAHAILDARLPLGAGTMDVVAHVLSFRDEIVLVGTGIGDHGSLGRGALIDGLETLELAPDDIDLVLLTHLHPEIVGGLVTRDGAPVFANARVVSCRTEWRWWNQNDTPPGLPARYLPFVPLARAATAPYDAAGRLGTFSGTEVVSAGITGFPVLGHTAGHSLFTFDTVAGPLMTLGDLVAVPEQLMDPALAIGLDRDDAMAADTRRRLLARLAEEGAPVLPAHDPTQSVARVMAQAKGFALAPP